MTTTDTTPNPDTPVRILDQALLERHQDLAGQVRDIRVELVRIERLLETRGVPFESFFPPSSTPRNEVRITVKPGTDLAGAAERVLAAEDAVAKIAASSARPAPGAQPAGGVSGVIPPATPAPPAKKTAKPAKAKRPGSKTSFVCDQCSRTFATYGGLRIHQGRSGHAGELPAPAHDDVVPKTGADDLERQPAPPPVVIDDDTMALRCDDCSFAAPVGPIQPLRVHVLEAHSRALSNTERRPRLVVE